MTDDSRPALVAAGPPADTATPKTDRRDGLSAPASGAATESPAARRRWALFAILAVAVVVADQAAKALVTRALEPGQSIDVIGDLLRIVFGQNSGALFGLFKDNAAMFGIVSIVVVALIVTYHARSASSLYLTVTLGFLLGGAIGNMVDRLRLGYVVDFVDIGIGQTRFYTFNVADSAISLAILLLFVAALRPSLLDGAAARPAPAASALASAPALASTPALPTGGEPPTGGDDDWGDGLEPDDRPPAGDRAR